MIAIKSSRKSLRLLSDEEDNLLAGVDFQTYYLGRQEIQIGDRDLDTIVEGIYSQYMYNGDLNNSTQLTITVDTNQLIFRDVGTHEIEFIIALSNVKSVFCASKKTKFPNAVIIVCCLPPQTSATIHVLHCLSQTRAREFYNAINRAFEYQGGASNGEKSLRSTESKTTTFSKANKDLAANAVSGNKVNTTKSKKYQELNNAVEAKRKETSVNENSGLLGEDSMLAKHEELPVKEIAPTRSSAREMTETQDESTVLRSRSRAKSTPQTKTVEGRGLLDNIDPDDAFDDEFTDLARNRSLSDNIKARFGR